MAGQRLAGQLEGRLGKGDRVANPDQLVDLARQPAHVYEQVFERRGLVADFRRQEAGRRLHDDARQVFKAMHRDWLPRQDARVHTADSGHAQEAAFCDAGHHKADGVHVGCDEQGWARACGCALAQSVQGAESAAAEFMNQRSPFFFNYLGGGSFEAGESGGGEQFFEEGLDVGHVSIYDLRLAIGDW